MTTEETAKALHKALGGTGFEPTDAQLRVLREFVKGPTRRQRIAIHLRRLAFFCECIGAVVIQLPRTGPELAREFWHELRTGQEPAWRGLAAGVTAACFFGAVALLATAAQH